MADLSTSYYRQHTFEESPALSSATSSTLSSSSMSDGGRKDYSREGSCSSFEESVKKKPILRKSTSFQKRKSKGRTGKKISFKPNLEEVFNVESFKEFNVDMSEYYDFMGVQCQKTSCTMF